MMIDKQSSPVSSVALLGNFLPRHCGIATFTTNLVAALSAEQLGLQCGVVAMNDAGKSYSYDKRVLFEIAESNLPAYRRAADFLNVGGFDVLSVQHEYGIFGGKSGAHLLSLLGALRMPIVTTLHTVLGEPSSDQRRVMNEILRLSTRVVVMSNSGISLLGDVHDVPPEKIDMIPHGIPRSPDRERSRARLRITDSQQLLTFGLLSPDKGIEYVIDALPAVIKNFPKVKYVIVGATHPQVKESQGEAYRRSLQLRVRKLGLMDHVEFHDRFVSDRELGEFLAAADVYLTPYLNPEQITSGTLAYAIGAGKAVISTPYRYAQELLADDRGILVPWRDSSSIAAALNRVLGDSSELKRLSDRAAAFGQEMTWASVAVKYKDTFSRAQEQFSIQRRTRATTGWGMELPELSLRHVTTLTDSTGILQHARFSVPRYEDGYCTDDNARALLLTTLIDDEGTDDSRLTRTLSTRYLAFISHAFNAETRRFRNFMSFSRAWLEENGSEDSHGRALWALGTVVGRSYEPGRTSLAGELFHQGLSIVGRFGSYRSLAFSLLGIAEYLKAFKGDREVENLQRALAARLFSAFEDNATESWPWCEPQLTYDNARLPQALIVSGHCLKDEALIGAGLNALSWLTKIQTSEHGCFAPIGSNGFFPRDEERAQFDQQPLEACATISACMDAWRVTAHPIWAGEMGRAFGWFLGENDGNTPLYDHQTHGCRDGLHSDRANENQGAESTLSFLLALMDMRSLASEIGLNLASAVEEGTN